MCLRRRLQRSLDDSPRLDTGNGASVCNRWLGFKLERDGVGDGHRVTV